MGEKTFEEEVLERLVRIETRLGLLGCADHEKRIRAVEKFQYLLLGGFVVVEIVLTIIFKSR